MITIGMVTNFPVFSIVILRSVSAFLEELSCAHMGTTYNVIGERRN